MLDFVRKLFNLKTRPGVHPLDGATRQAMEAPYKLEVPPKEEVKYEPDNGPLTEAQVEQVKESVKEKPKKEAKPKAEKPAKETKAEKPKKETKPQKPKTKKSA